MSDTQEGQETIAMPQPWFGRVLDTLNPEHLPQSLGNIDDEPEWVFNVVVLMMQAAAPAFQFRQARNLTPDFVGRLMGQQCANVLAVREWVVEANLTPEQMKQAETMVQVLDTKREVPGVASTLQMLEFGGQMVESLGASEADHFQKQVIEAFRKALSQPSRLEAAEFFSGFAHGLSRPGLSSKGLASDTSATLIYMKLFVHRDEVKKLGSVSELREFLIQNGVKVALLGQPKRLEKICERIKLKLANRGRPTTAEKSDASPA